MWSLALATGTRLTRQAHIRPQDGRHYRVTESLPVRLVGLDEFP